MTTQGEVLVRVHLRTIKWMFTNRKAAPTCCAASNSPTECPQNSNRCTTCWSKLADYSCFSVHNNVCQLPGAHTIKDQARSVPNCELLFCSKTRNLIAFTVWGDVTMSDTVTSRSRGRNKQTTSHLQRLHAVQQVSIFIVLATSFVFPNILAIRLLKCFWRRRKRKWSIQKQCRAASQSFTHTGRGTCWVFGLRISLTQHKNHVKGLQLSGPHKAELKGDESSQMFRKFSKRTDQMETKDTAFSSVSFFSSDIWSFFVATVHWNFVTVGVSTSAGGPCCVVVVVVEHAHCNNDLHIVCNSPRINSIIRFWTH